MVNLAVNPNTAETSGREDRADTPSSLNPKPYRNPKPQTPNKPQILNLTETLNPKPQTPNKPQTLSRPKPLSSSAELASEFLGFKFASRFRARLSGCLGYMWVQFGVLWGVGSGVQGIWVLVEFSAWG